MSLRASLVVFAVAALSSTAGRAAASAGKTVYDRDCTQCHGAAGKGDGEEAQYLTPTPKDFASGILEKRGDDFLAAVIAEGGKAKGLSESMPAFPKLSRQEVKDVIGYIRQLGKGSTGQKGK